MIQPDFSWSRAAVTTLLLGSLNVATAATNHVPTISGSPATTAVVGQLYQFAPRAADSDGDRLRFYIRNQPAGSSFSSSTGALSGKPDRATTYRNIVIGVSDGSKTAELAPFSVTVKAAASSKPPTNEAPAISGAPASTATVGIAYSFTPTASDPDGDSLAFSISNKPAWASFSTVNGKLTGTPAAAGTAANITISVSDGKKTTSLRAFSITVAAATGGGSGGAVNTAPKITGSPSTTATVGSAYSFQATGSDANNDALTYSIANKPAWATFSTASGLLSGTPTSSNVGTTSGIVIGVSDGKGGSASLPAFSVTVSGATSTSADLCNGLVQDKVAHPMTALAKPARGGAVTDPQFGTRIVRITDAAAQFKASVAKPAYSTIPAWNADESYLILYVTEGSSAGHYLFNGRTYALIRKLDIDPTDIEHFYWSSTDPDVLFYSYASGSSTRQLIRYHVGTDTKDVMYNVPNVAGSSQVDFGSDPMYSSWDNDLFGLRRESSSATAFIYRTSSKVEGPRIASDDAPQVCSSGRCYVLNSKVYDSSTNAVIRNLKSAAIEHGDMLMLANGQDVRASNQFDVNPNGTLIAENLTTGVVTEVMGVNTGWPYPPTHTHISGHATRAPGWVAVSVTGNPKGQGVLDSELVLANLNTNKVCRVGHHRSAGDDGPNGYWAEPHVNISPSGTRLLFGSDWGSGSTVDAYVVELPSYRR